jgi:hypothetical protein
VGLGFAAELEFGSFGEEPDARVRAQKLDEGLAVLNGLMSGEPLELSGSHFNVSRTRFLPTPTQRPRVPIWVGGWWPNNRPYERAARWDGVVPELAGGRTPSVAQVEDIVAFIAERRTSSEPFDVVINGVSDGSLVEEYEQAGVTWWLERFEPDGRFSVDEVRKQILEGPPVTRRSEDNQPTIGGAA